MHEKRSYVLPRPTHSILPEIHRLVETASNTYNNNIIAQQHLDKLLTATAVNADEIANMDENDTEKLYLRVKRMIMTNQMLRDYVKTLSELNETLEECDHELKEIVAIVRKHNEQQLQY